MVRFGSVPNFVKYGVVLTAVVLQLLTHNRITTGIIPLMHLGIPYGFTQAQMDETDVSKLTVVITGANSGLGFGTGMQLAKRGVKRLVLACRSVDKCRVAASKMRAVAPPSSTIETTTLDLSNLKSCAKWVSEIKNKLTKIDVFIANAGVMHPQKLTKTEQGLELQFGVNHVGHHYVVTRLMDLIEKAASETKNARIVVVSSVGHWFSPNPIPLDMNKINDPNWYDDNKHYGISKAANVLFVNRLARDAPKGLFVNAVHPGGVRGELARHHIKGSFILTFVHDYLYSQLQWSEEEGALSVLAPAVSSNPPNGAYYVPIGRVVPSSWMTQSKENADDLWVFTEGLIQKLL